MRDAIELRDALDDAVASGARNLSVLLPRSSVLVLNAPLTVTGMNLTIGSIGSDAADASAPPGRRLDHEGDEGGGGGGGGDSDSDSDPVDALLGTRARFVMGAARQPLFVVRGGARLELVGVALQQGYVSVADSGSGGWRGGCVDVADGAHALVLDSVLVRCGAEAGGGGIAVSGVGASARVASSIIYQGFAFVGGGCILLRDGASAVVVDSRLLECQVGSSGSSTTSGSSPPDAASAGAIAVGDASSNRAAEIQIYLDGSVGGTPLLTQRLVAPPTFGPLTSLEMTDSTIEGATAIGNADATGGVGVFRGLATLERVRIVGASTDTTDTSSFSGSPPKARSACAVHAALPGTLVTLISAEISRSCERSRSDPGSTYNYPTTHPAVQAHAGATLHLVASNITLTAGVGVVANSGSEVSLTRSMVASSSGTTEVGTRDDYQGWSGQFGANATVVAQLHALYRLDRGPTVLLADGSTLGRGDSTKSTASNSLVIDALVGSVLYKLPTPPGHFIFDAALCYIDREACPASDFQCAFVAESDQCLYNITAAPPCQPILPHTRQRCEWHKLPALLRQRVSQPIREATNTLPLPCSPGVVSEADSLDHQSSIRCGGLCPAGHTCSKPATLSATLWCVRVGAGACAEACPAALSGPASPCVVCLSCMQLSRSACRSVAESAACHSFAKPAGRRALHRQDSLEHSRPYADPPRFRSSLARASQPCRHGMPGGQRHPAPVPRWLRFGSGGRHQPGRLRVRQAGPL